MCSPPTSPRGTRMSEKLQLPKSLPKVQRKHLKSVLKRHLNARLLCDEGRYEKAAALLCEDNFFVAGNCLRKISQPAQA
jgi:hypothetical protein